MSQTSSDIFVPSNEQIQQFTSVTGSTADEATRMLEVCAGNVEMAVGMFVDGQQSAENVESKDTSAAEFSATGEEEVRAPIPQRTEVLVQENYRPPRRRQRHTVFDGFRNFQVEAAARASGNSASSRKKRSLEELFRPPIDLTFDDTWEAVREEATKKNLFLLVNIQNPKEFTCQALNRDVWSNQQVRDIVKENFVFWQVYDHSQEGEKYMQFYPVTEWPYVAIIDPRTGEKMLEISKVDAGTFSSLTADFLSQNSLEPAAQCKRLKREECVASDEEENSILNASEDSQLQAAIKASLVSVAVPNHFSSDSEPEIFSDRSGSVSPLRRSPSPSPMKKNLGKGKQPRNGMKVKSSKKSHPVANLQNSPSSLMSSSASSPESSMPNGSCSMVESSRTVNCEPKKALEASHPEAAEGPRESSEHWQDYQGDDNEPKSELILRFPNGQRELLKLARTSKLKAVYLFAADCGFHWSKFEFVTNFPRRNLDNFEDTKTLLSVGLFPTETIFVQSR